jgi:hypothetical protein
VYQVIQANPPAPLLMDSQVLQGNQNNSSLAIDGLGRIRQVNLDAFVGQLGFCFDHEQVLEKQKSKL